MPDENPNPGQQQPPVNAPPTGGPQGNPPAGAGSDDGESVDGLKAALKAERDARKAYEKQIRELSAWKQQQEDAGRTEAEKTAARMAQLEADNRRLGTIERERALEREVARLNRGDSKLGLVDEDAALRLLDQSAIEFDAAGKPTNLLPLLKGLIQERPYLATATTRRPGSVDGGSGNTTTPGLSFDDRIRTIAGYR